MKLILKVILTSVSLLSTAMIFAGGDINADIKDVIAGEHRAKSAMRDQYRHPQQTLNFFQVKDNHSVVEIWPGGGAWYTQILAPYLSKKGQFYAAQYNPETDNNYQKKTLKKFHSKMAEHTELYSKVNMVVFNPPSDINLGAPGSVDRVLTFRNVHNWTRAGDEDVLAIFQAFYQVLKSGGKLGVVEHRLPEDRTKGTAGYVKESYVIKMAEAAGFKLEARSDINANAKDNADYEKGVWTLPPTLALKETDKEKYLAIGESDRMTLLFVKK